MRTYRNAQFVTCEENCRTFTAMAVNRGRIAWIGLEEDMPASLRAAPAVDLGGSTVTPAFGDTHIHFASLCVFENTFYLMDAENFREAGEIVAAFAARKPRAKILIGFGCSAHTVEEGRLPCREDLDRWTARPLMVVKYDGHAAVCNSALMELLPQSVKEDPGCRADTGWLYQNAFFAGVNAVTSSIPTLDIVRGLTAGANYLASVGVGMVHNVEGVGFPRDLDVDMLRLLLPGLPQAYRLFFQTMDLEAVRRRKLPRVGGCFKLALDGCFGSEDAALLEPYANDPHNRGVLYYTQEQVNDFVIRANRMGLQIALHAIGDAAVEQCITAFEAAWADCPRPDARHIMIHCCMVSPSQLDRIARLKMCLAVQSPFIVWKQEPDRYLCSILGRQRTDGLNPLASMLRRGIVLGDGSDGPTTRPNPLVGMSFAVNHPNPQERISRLDALRMITANPAYLSFDEKDRGTLTAGKIADFVVLSDNPLTAPDPAAIQVEDLYLAGKRFTPLSPSIPALVGRSIFRRLFRREFL